MIIRIRVFGQLAQAAGSSAIELTVAQGATCSAVRRQLATAVPALAPHLQGCRFAINHAFATEQQQVNPEEEIALIGLVCGG